MKIDRFCRLKLWLPMLVFLLGVQFKVFAVEVIMSGVSGNSSAQMLSRINKDVLAHKPSTVLVLAGTNDMLNSGKLASYDQFEINVNSIVDQILAINSEVVLMTVPPCVEAKLYTRHDAAAYGSEGANGRVRKANEIITKIAGEKNLIVVDMYKLFNDNISLIKSDGVHPTDAGYSKMASMLNDTIVANDLPTAKVVCFGNSITTHYPDYLRPLLGASACGGFDAFSRIEAEDYCVQVGLDTETCSEGTLNVGWVNANEFCAYNDINLTGAKSMDVRVASKNATSSIEVRIDATNGTLLGTIPVPNTGDFQKWVTKSIDIEQVEGAHDVFLLFRGGTGFLLNLNWLQFSKNQASTALHSLNDNSDFVMYPNPVGDRLTMNLGEGSYSEIEIMDMNGRKLLTQKVNSGSKIQEIKCTSLTNGSYLLILKNDETRSVSHFVKN